MNKLARSPRPLVWGLLLLVTITSLSSCKHDLSKVQATMAKYEPALEAGKDIELVYTEDGKKRITLTAPSLVYHKLKDPYYEFEKGLFVRFYSEDGRETPPTS